MWELIKKKKKQLTTVYKEAVLSSCVAFPVANNAEHPFLVPNLEDE